MQVVEIIEQVYLEIMVMMIKKRETYRWSCHNWGWSQLKHLKQLVEYITGMDTRIGYPSEHLAGDTQNNETSPILSTAVGLLMNALDQQNDICSEKKVAKDADEGNTQNEEPEELEVNNPFVNGRKTILERWVEKFKEFLDNA